MIRSYTSLIVIFTFTAILSFFNQIVYANYFGTSSAFDVLNAVLSLPFSIIGVGTGAISLILMPLLHKAKKEHGGCECFLILALKRHYKYIFVLAIGIILIQIFTLHEKINDENLPQFIKLSFFSIIFLILSLLNSYFVVYFNLKNQLFLASINAMSTYALSILLCIFFAERIGIDIVIYSLILSNILLLILFYYNFKKNTYIAKKIHINMVAVKPKVLAAGILSILPFTIPVFIDAYFLLPMSSGSLSYASYANKIIIMVTTILVQPINLILFPKILENNDNYRFIKDLLFKFYIFVFFSVFIVYILAEIFFLDFMHLFFERGAFTREDSEMLYTLFLIYLIGIVGMMSMNIQNKILTALSLYNVQIYFSLAFVATYLICMVYFSDMYGYLSVGYSYAFSWTMYSIFIFLIINRKLTASCTSID